MQSPRINRLSAPLVVVAAATACVDDEPAAPVLPAAAAASVAAAVPAPLAAVSFGGASRTLWPFTGRSFSEPADPINLVFTGRADPLSLRAALLSLDGDRTAFGFPGAAPFDCTWADAVGGHQTAWSEASGWTGSAVQLDCGGYGPLRTHLRLFRSGDWTLGGAHFELLIPGTADHAVLSWMLARQFVTVDLIRSGLLDTFNPLGSSGVISPAPAWRTIDHRIYNALPPALIAALGTPPPPAAAPVPIPSDGRATILNVAGAVESAPAALVYRFDVTYDQVVPRPFCASGPADFVHVAGPVTFHHSVLITPGGSYAARTRIRGTLQITPFVGSGPAGPTRTATIERDLAGHITPAEAFVTDDFLQLLRRTDPDAPAQSSRTILRVGPGQDRFTTEIRCE